MSCRVRRSSVDEIEPSELNLHAGKFLLTHQLVEMWVVKFTQKVDHQEVDSLGLFVISERILDVADTSSALACSIRSPGSSPC